MSCKTEMRRMTLEDIQKQSLEILKKTDDFCRENGITYYLSYGTLIGAARHKGFIPWDDDIDILVPRPDYERLCKIFKADGLEILGPHNTPGCYLPFARICDTRVTRVISTNPWIKNRTEYGLWIDIFPLDSVTDDQEEFTALYRRMLALYKEELSIRRRKTKIHKAFGLKRNFKTVLHWFLHPIRHFQDPMRLRDQVMEAMAACPEYGSTGHLSMLPCPERDWEWFPKEDFEGTATLEFCGREFPVPAGWDHHLRQVFGDYMQMPPEEERRPKQLPFIRYYWK